MCECCYYFANSSTESVCLSVRVCAGVLMLVYTMLRCYARWTSFWRSNGCNIHSYVHTQHTFNAFARVKDSVCEQPRNTPLTSAMKATKQDIYIFICMFLFIFLQRHCQTHNRRYHSILMHISGGTFPWIQKHETRICVSARISTHTPEVKCEYFSVWI